MVHPNSPSGFLVGVGLVEVVFSNLAHKLDVGERWLVPNLAHKSSFQQGSEHGPGFIVYGCPAGCVPRGSWGFQSKTRPLH